MPLVLCIDHPVCFNKGHCCVCWWIKIVPVHIQQFAGGVIEFTASHAGICMQIPGELTLQWLLRAVLTALCGSFILLIHAVNHALHEHQNVHVLENVLQTR